MKCGLRKVLRVSPAAAAVFVALSAQAADLYGPSMSMKDVYPYGAAGWAGLYLGVNGGYGWGSSSDLNASAFQYGDPYAVATAAKLKADGGLGGGQIGYNWQWGTLVAGIEADIQGSNIGGSASANAVNYYSFVYTDAWAQTNLDWFGTLRGRLGMSAGSWLVYGTGGLAFGGVRDSLGQSLLSNDTTPYSTLKTDAASRNATLTGYAAGGGIEKKLTPSWSVKAEYLRIDLGSTTLSANRDIAYSYNQYCLTTCTDNGNSSVKINHVYDTVRFGLNYKIGQSYEPLK